MVPSKSSHISKYWGSIPQETRNLSRKRVIPSPFALLLRGPLRPPARDKEMLYHEATFPALVTFGLLGSGLNTAMQVTWPGHKSQDFSIFESIWLFCPSKHNLKFCFTSFSFAGVGVLLACFSVHRLHITCCPRWSEEGVRCPGAGTRDSSKPPRRCWDLKPGPLEQQPVLLTAESSFPIHHSYFL